MPTQGVSIFFKKKPGYWLPYHIFKLTTNHVTHHQREIQKLNDWKCKHIKSIQWNQGMFRTQVVTRRQTLRESRVLSVNRFTEEGMLSGRVFATLCSSSSCCFAVTTSGPLYISMSSFIWGALAITSFTDSW